MQVAHPLQEEISERAAKTRYWGEMSLGSD